MGRKSAQLQIRVSPEQKRLLRRLAREAGTDMSAWILDRVLPAEGARFQKLTAALAAEEEKSLALAELSEFLRGLAGGAFARATAQPPGVSLDDATLSHLSAAIDRGAARRGIAPPTWVAEAPAAAQPQFGSALHSVRLHLLTTSPVAFRQRNIFVDASIDERV